jgi:hypothetical protein
MKIYYCAAALAMVSLLGFSTRVTANLIPVSQIKNVTCSPNPELLTQQKTPCGVAALPSAPTSSEGGFVEGVVQGRWVGLVMIYSGTNGFASYAHVFAVGDGGNGPLTTNLGIITAMGASKNSIEPDRLDAHFANDRLYTINPIYLPGQAHCCPTNFMVQRFGFHGKTSHDVGDRFMLEGSAMVSNHDDYLKAPIP